MNFSLKYFSEGLYLHEVLKSIMRPECVWTHTNFANEKWEKYCVDFVSPARLREDLISGRIISLL